MGELSEFQIGQTVELQDGRVATVRYVGETHFAPGDWIGVELDEPSGKNDGAVQGQRYFDCTPAHGMFIRPAVAAILDQPTPKPATKLGRGMNGTLKKPGLPPTTAGTSRRQSVLEQTVGKTQNINAGSLTLGARAAPSLKTFRSPYTSPTKQVPSTTTSGNAAPKLPAPGPVLKSTNAIHKPRSSIAGRPSMSPPPPSVASRSSRQSIAGTLDGASNPTTRPPVPSSRSNGSRLSTLQSGTRRTGSTSGSSQASGRSGQESPADVPESEMLSPPLGDFPDGRMKGAHSPALSRASTTSRSIISPDTALSYEKASSAVSQRTPPASSSLVREVEDLKIKLRMMEKRRLEDREKLNGLEKVQNERDKFEGIIQKLQAKYQPQQQEILDLKRQLREAEAKAEASETAQVEVDSAVEMATLDREMAEETAEALQTELTALRQAHEELGLEVEILREENAELGKEMSSEERTSQGWVQMERSNNRLREALMRLRDATQEQEAGLKQQIKELERDVHELGNIRVQYETTREKLSQSNAANEDLRQQLDTALGGEEMIEELSEKNMLLTEQLDDLKATIEDLESLKELNDELEMNHVETEKQLQEEIDYQESLLSEQTKKFVAQDATIDDLEYTVSRLRDLVTNLQSDLEDMRASQQITEAEANDLSSRSRAMMDLNMRLQMSASKAQVKVIDLELKRLEAQESAEHLSIVQHFLPETFDCERNSVLALLRFRRIEFKSDLMHSLCKEKVSGPLAPGHEDEVFATCDILNKLTWVSNMCDRFVHFIRRCDLEAFGKLEGALYELEPVERALNGWIDGVKKDELKHRQCALELQRSIALMTHLAEVHISNDLEQYAEDLRMRALLMQSNLENSALALSHIKSIAQSKLPTAGDAEDEDNQQADGFFRKMESLLSQVRTAKVIASKAIHNLEELQSRSLTLNPSTLPTVEQLQASTSELTNATRNAGISLVGLITHEERTSAFAFSELESAISLVDSPASSSLISQIQTTATQMQQFHTLTMTLSQTIEFPDTRTTAPPWVLLACKLRDATSKSAAHEEEVKKLAAEVREKNTALAMKDKLVEDMNVNIEILEKRIGESGGRRERVRELEMTVESARSKERELAKKLYHLQQNLQAAEADRENLSKQASESEANARTRAAAGQHEVTSVQAQEEIAQLRTEISVLQSTIRYLRLSTHHASLQSSHSFLSTPLLPSSPVSEKTHLAHEARDVLRSMLALVTRPESQVVQLRLRERDERLKWRPVRESTRWQVGRQREEWEAWREWRDDVGQRGKELSREDERKRRVGRHSGETVPMVDFGMLGLEDEEKRMGTEVKIVQATGWGEMEEGLAIA